VISLTDGQFRWDGREGRMKMERQTRKDRRSKGRQERKESGRVGRASRGGRRWELNGGKGSGSINYETIAEFGLCCRIQARTGALSCFNLSGQPSIYIISVVQWKQTKIQECLAMHGNHVMLK
jgi:hypothetical protein